MSDWYDTVEPSLISKKCSSKKQHKTQKPQSPQTTTTEKPAPRIYRPPDDTRDKLFDICVEKIPVDKEMDSYEEYQKCVDGFVERRIMESDRMEKLRKPETTPTVLQRIISFFSRICS